MALNEPADAINAVLGQVVLIIGTEEAILCGPGADPGARELPPDSESIRAHVRASDSGAYRPLSGLRNMPTNWHARFRTLDALSEAVDAVYPLAQRHAGLFADGSLEVVSLDDVLARQAGRYASAMSLSPAGRARARSLLCGACVRVPLWAGEHSVPEGGIPCPEPCSVMLSLCREAALWENERPAPAEPDPAIPFAAFEQPGNQLREAYLRNMGDRE